MRTYNCEICREEFQSTWTDAEARPEFVARFGYEPKGDEPLLCDDCYEAGNCVMPTGTCFDDSVQLIVEILTECPEMKDSLRLVHAICAPENREPFAHAWVEDIATDTALFMAVHTGPNAELGVMDKSGRVALKASIDEFRAYYGVVEATSYTYAQLVALNVETGHVGPWEQRYRELCR